MLEVPASIQHRGTQRKLVIEDAAGPRLRAPDPALIQALDRAFTWVRRLQKSEVNSVRELADQVGLSGSYTTRILRLAFLAPDIIEAITNGQHPIELTTNRLLRGRPLPLSWNDQRKQLGTNAT